MSLFYSSKGSSGHTIVNSNGNSLTKRSKLQFKNALVEDDATNGTTVVTVQAGAVVKLAEVSGASVTSNLRTATIKWTDPENISISGVEMAKWKGTRIIRKSGSAPTNYEDGTLIKDSKTKNQHSSTGLTDSNLSYGTTYYYGFYPYTEGGVFSDGTSISVTPVKANASTPTQVGTLTYNGSSQTPTWSYDYSKMTKSETAQINAGNNYSTTFTLNEDYKWEDGTSGNTKTITWSIGKATSAPSVSSSSVTLNTTNKTKTVTVGNILDRNISVSSSNTSVATASISGTTVTISHVNQTSGSATIYVTAAETDNYAQSTASISVTASFVDTTLDNNDWATIQGVAQAGNGSSYWNVGDRIGVKLNGTVRARTLSNYTWYAYILGFNHNASKEGNNTIHFKFGFNALSGGIHTALTDWTNTKAYGATSGTRFCMNDSNTNVGGWASSLMRLTTIPEFINCLPTTLKNVLKAVTKYTDNSGNSSNVVDNVTTTSDKVFLLSEYEEFGTRSYANQYEYTDGKQAQYDYFKNGNSKVMYNDQVTGTAVIWWSRSAYYDNATLFCFVNAGGNAGYYSANGSIGFAPGFAVG